MIRNSFKSGLKDGLPIALGYLSVSFAFGISCSRGGLSPLMATVISMTNLTSAGQFAGLTLMLSSASLIEMAATQFIINLRYALMSLSLSQKLSAAVTDAERFIIAFFNTDEIFAVASGGEGEVGTRYMLGLGCLPFIGWSLGTLLGSVAGELLPASVTSALGIAIYGMFVAIVVPPMKKSRAVIAAVAVSAALSCLIRCFIPSLSAGFSIIICAVLSSALCAALFPVKEARQ